MTEEFTLAPVAGWEIRLIASVGGVAVTMKYLVSLMERPDEAHSSPNFLLAAPQLLELSKALLEAAQRLESSPAPGAIGPTH